MTRAHRFERTDEHFPCRDCGRLERVFWAHRSLPGYWRCTRCYSQTLSGPERGGWKATEAFQREVRMRPGVAA